MSIVAVQVRLPWNTNAAVGPVSSNTLHFDSFGVTPSETNLTPVLAAVGGLYGAGFAGLLSSMLTGEMLMSVYNLDDTPPRLPIMTGAGTVNVETNSIAPESSINIGYRYPRVSGVPTQRGRGTLHIGPLSEGACDPDGLLPTSALDQIESALGDFATAIHATLYEFVTGTELHGFQTIERFTVANDLGIVRRRDLQSTDKRTVAY